MQHDATAAKLRRFSRRPLNLLLAASIMLSGCSLSGLADKIFDNGHAAIQEASNQIDQTVSQLQTTSTSWQQVLQDMQSHLSEDARNLINSDLQNLISRTVGRSGVEFRCDADFVNNRVAEGLLAIKAKLLGQVVTPAVPRLCQAVPEAVEVKQIPLGVPTLTFYGYNLDLKSSLRLKHYDHNGVVRDVTDAVNVPTPYAMTVTLGASGARLDASSDHFILFWNDTPLSRVAIIPPEAPVKICKTSVVELPVQDIGPYTPPKAGNGDKDFNGNGPRVRIDALANTTTDRISVRLTMNALETKKDWTEVNGSAEYPVYKVPAGSAIDRLASAEKSHLTVVEEGNTSRNTPHQLNLGLGGLLQYVRIVGDTDGDDVGRTQVSARLNPLSVVIHETEGCVPGTALIHLLGTRYLSTSLQRDLSPRVRADDSRLRTEMQRFRHP